MPDLLQCWSPLIQGGFAIFSLMLLGVVVWLVKQLLKVLRDNSKVIEQNTEAFTVLSTTSQKTEELMQDIHDQLLARPCLLKHDD